MLKNLLLVGLGGCIGSMGRYLAGYFIKSTGFPFATLFVNILGSMLIGIIIGLTLKDEQFSTNWKLFLATGICGGFTTFSAFSAENLDMLQQGKYILSLGYVCVTILCGIVAAWIGFKITAP
jgi:fluoride exporter